MERLMQYVWQHRLLLPGDHVTVDGRNVSVIDPGRLNTNAGPDFFNAKVKIDGRVWAGDVEIHVKASDWHRHGHDGNPAYDSVILHVVGRDDTMITRSNGEVIPQMKMDCVPEFSAHYNELVGRAATDLPCGPELGELKSVEITDWLSALMFERIYAKTDRIVSLLDATAGDWQTACYVTVARALGFGVNAEPMERLARNVPLRILHKHSDSLTAVEAILFGQSGLLDSAPTDDFYAGVLRDEYRFYAAKFGLTPSQPLGWKMSRMRPQNFPHRRIALLAKLVAGGYCLFDQVVKTESAEEAMKYFLEEPDGYWAEHFTFGPAAPTRPGALGRRSAALMVINAVVPLMMAYASRHGDDELWERGLGLLYELPPESNSIIALFGGAGIKCRDAAMSQALIQLRRCYCETHKCLYCRFGHRLLAKRALRRGV